MVKSVDEVKQIIDIFTETPLNSNKQLNFLAFKKAFELYTEGYVTGEQLRDQIEEIRSQMNKNRTNFEWIDRQFNITPGWLLGFVEGDGSFSINLTKVQDNSYLKFRFMIAQSATDLDLLIAIKNYLNGLASSSVNLNTENLVDTSNQLVNFEDENHVSMYLTEAKNDKLNAKGKCNLVVQNIGFITEILIPYFDRLTFQTKKGLDYVDFKNILLLKEKGFHFTPEGLSLIQLILNQMNNNRLSTNSEDNTLESRELLLLKIKELLAKPSNIEVKEDGKIFIKSLNRYSYDNTKAIAIQMTDETGLVIKTWPSLTSCAESLELSKSGIQKRLKNATYFNFEGKRVFLSKN